MMIGCWPVGYVLTFGSGAESGGVCLSAGSYVNGPNLRNERADREVAAVLDRIRNAAQAGLRSAEKRSADLKLMKNFRHR